MLFARSGKQTRNPKLRLFPSNGTAMERSATTRLFIYCATFLCGSSLAHHAAAQNGAGSNRPDLYVNDQTGYVYRKVFRTVERPTTETRMERRTETVYTPQVVTTTRPENRTYYSPVLGYEWETRLHGWWNPFTQPTVAYHAVPRTRWEARSESVERRETRTEWVAEHRTREVPTQLSRIERQTVTDYEVVGRLNRPSNAESLAGNSGSGGASLRLLRDDEQMIALNGSPSSFGSADVQVASRARPLHSGSTVTSAPDNSYRRGLRPTVLSPGAPPYSGNPVATAPFSSRWR